MLCGLLLGSTLAAWSSWTKTPTPLDDAHLTILHPTAWTDANGGALKTTVAPDAVTGQTLIVQAPVQQQVRAKAAGSYHLWLRVAKGNPQRALAVTLLNGETPVLAGSINDGAGSPARGGPAGYQQYAAVAQEHASQEELDPERDPFEIIPDLGDADHWVNRARIEPLADNAPYYWWHLGPVTLQPGRYLVKVSGGGAQLSVGMLTTSTILTYPFAGDLDIPPATYLRFRLTKVPPGGAVIGATMRMHYTPWSISLGYFTPTGLAKEAVPHKTPGYTGWYRLQDAQYVPGVGATDIHLLFGITAGAEGATQFAAFPHADAVVREFSWQEPEGTRISLRPDVVGQLASLRTFRDHAREQYEMALHATGSRLFPLTRAPLCLTNAWGYDDGISADYMLKTLRLLGINNASCPDPVENRRRYGWSSAGGQYWTTDFLPFDETQARQAFTATYNNAFVKRSAEMADMPMYQVADEPGEVAREAIASPLWRYYPAERGGPKWVDAVGGSELTTRRSDYRDCVLEGKIARSGRAVGLKIMEAPEKGSRYAVWFIGNISGDDPRVTAVSYVNGNKTDLRRPAMSIGQTPVPFKIVYHHGTAALFLNGANVHMLTDLPTEGAFVICGDQKTVTALTIRPLTGKDELGSTTPDDPEGGEDIEDIFANPNIPDTPKPLEQFVKEDWQVTGGMPAAHVGFRAWAQAQGPTSALFGKTTWADVSPLTAPALIESDADRRLYYWSRKYSSYLTPKMFSLGAEAIHAAAPDQRLKGFVALSGHALHMAGSMPLDMFQLASYGGALVPGISDWMFVRGWRWDTHQVVAYSVAPYNAGARVYGGPPRSLPMMHCVFPTPFRAYTMLANNVKTVSYFNFGPGYQVTEAYWSESPECYTAVHETDNRTALVDDVLGPALMRPSRVAMLYAMSNEYWDPAASFADKRAAFLGLSHEYYQPELVTEEQVAAGCLRNYDALYVLDPGVADAAQGQIAAWVKGGGLLWSCADALRWNEYHDPSDFLQRVAGLSRTFLPEPVTSPLEPAAGETAIARQTTPPTTVGDVTWPNARLRASYADGRPAWLEGVVGKGRVVYLAHRCGLSYTAKQEWSSDPWASGGVDCVWKTNVGREPLVLPLTEAKVSRELVLSQPMIMANPLTSDAGTVMVLFNMQDKPTHDLTLTLRQPTPPVSVQAFRDMTLVDLPYTYADGQLRLTLPELATGQMILVRTKSAPDDERLALMQANTRRLLASGDWQDLTAGAFFAGFFPAWQLQGRLEELLTHPHFAVRRAAAEALGRLQAKGAAERLAAMAATETDAHAQGDALYALALLDEARFVKLAPQHAANSSVFVRRQLLRGAQAGLRGPARATVLPCARALLALAEDDLADARIATEVSNLRTLLMANRTP